MHRPRGRRFVPARPEESNRINRQIRVPEVRLVGADGEQLGILETQDALRLAQEAGLDLVEVAAKARPPVCRLMDYGKFRYAKQKKEAEAKRKQHTTQVKELRVRPGTDAHDMQRQTRKAREFLEDGQRVKFTLRFRGREMAHQALGKQKLLDIAEDLAEVGAIELAPRTEGRIMHLVMAPGQRKAKSDKGGEKASPAEKEPSPTAEQG